MKKVMLGEMSWSEFGEAMLRDDLVIFPVGSIEQHGPHNPLGTDYILAEATAKAIGEKAGAVVVPVYPVGNAKNLIEFPGTATLEPELLRELLFQSCECLIRHGAGRFLFINGHGGNTPVIKMVSADLFAKYAIMSTQTEWWTILAQISEHKCNDHGGKYETSMVMAVDEKLADMSKAHTVPRRGFTDKIQFEDALTFKGTKVALGFQLDAVTDVGNYGAKAEEANVELGREMFRIYVDYCVDLANELRKVTL